MDNTLYFSFYFLNFLRKYKIKHPMEPVLVKNILLDKNV